jgi:hypothetical protein
MAKENEGSEHERKREETDRTRLEVVQLLRQILQESRIEAHGATPAITEGMNAVIQLYKQIEAEIGLTCKGKIGRL